MLRTRTQSTTGDKDMLAQPLLTCIDHARNFQINLRNLFKSTNDAALQLVEALAYAPNPTSVVELSEEAPFERSYSVINKVLNAFGPGNLLLPSTITEIGDAKPPVEPVLFSQITRPFSDLFFQEIPKEINRKFRLFAIDATSIPRIHAHTLDDRAYVHQANQIGTPVTVGLQASILVYLPERSLEEANWQLPVSLERIATHTTAVEVAEAQLKLLHESMPDDGTLTIIVVDSAYGNLLAYSVDQVVIARARTDRKGRKPFKVDPKIDIGRGRPGRPRKYAAECIRFAEDMPPGTENASDEESTHESTMNNQPVDVLLNRWHDVYVEGHSEPVDVLKIEIFSKENCTEPMLPPQLLILSGKRKREVTSLDAFTAYRCRFDIEHFLRFMKQKLLFCAYQTPELDHQESWWWFCLMAYWLLYHVRHLAHGTTRKWHKKRDSEKSAGPGEVKRLFAAVIFPILGSPSHPPRICVKSKGREFGTRFTKRKRKKIVKKETSRRKVA